jgi:hypothetical protein
VELRKTEAVGAPDNHRIGAGHIEPGFDDVGGEQDVALSHRRT